MVSSLTSEHLYFVDNEHYDNNCMRTDDLEPFVFHESHQRSTAITLTRVLSTHFVPRANHVIRDEVACVVGLGALLVVDDRHVHLSQVTRRTSVLVQRTPTGSLSHAVTVRVVCNVIHIAIFSRRSYHR